MKEWFWARQSMKFGAVAVKRGVVGFFSKTRTSRDGSRNGKGRSSTALAMLKIEVEAPMPRARVRIAAAAKPGLERSWRSA